MNYRPSELTLTPLKDVPTGSLAEMIGRSDIPLVLRLTDKNDKARFMIMGGQYSFDVASWSAEDQMTRVVCSADELRVQLGDAAERGDHTTSGMLSLHRGGACITAKPGQSEWRGVKIGLGTWTEVDTDRGALVVYPDWKLGKLDHRGEFVSIFHSLRTVD